MDVDRAPDNSLVALLAAIPAPNTDPAPAQRAAANTPANDHATESGSGSSFATQLAETSGKPTRNAAPQTTAANDATAPAPPVPEDEAEDTSAWNELLASLTAAATNPLTAPTDDVTALTDAEAASDTADKDQSARDGTALPASFGLSLALATAVTATTIPVDSGAPSATVATTPVTAAPSIGANLFAALDGNAGLAVPATSTQPTAATPVTPLVDLQQSLTGAFIPEVAVKAATTEVTDAGGAVAAPIAPAASPTATSVLPALTSGLATSAIEDGTGVSQPSDAVTTTADLAPVSTAASGELASATSTQTSGGSDNAQDERSEDPLQKAIQNALRALEESVQPHKKDTKQVEESALAGNEAQATDVPPEPVVETTTSGGIAAAIAALTNARQMDALSAAPLSTSTLVTGDTQATMEPISHGIQQAIRTGDSLTVVLTPPDLGAMRIEIRTSHTGLRAQLETTTMEATRLVNDNIGWLHESLGQRGTTIERIEVVQSEAGQWSSGQNSPGMQNGSETNPRDQSTPQQQRRTNAQANPASDNRDSLPAPRDLTGRRQPLTQINLHV